MKRGSEGFRIWRLWFHRKDQWDLDDTGEVFPWLCVHWSTPGRSSRIFCAWHGGIQVGKVYL
jgi:hypothetical protein